MLPTDCIHSFFYFLRSWQTFADDLASGHPISDAVMVILWDKKSFERTAEVPTATMGPALKAGELDEYSTISYFNPGRFIAAPHSRQQPPHYEVCYGINGMPFDPRHEEPVRLAWKWADSDSHLAIVIHEVNARLGIQSWAAA